MNSFNKGIFATSVGSFWWGFIGVIYFKYFSFIGHIELVVHRCLWTSVTLLFTTIYFSKWDLFFNIISNKKYLFILFFTSILIFINWSVWIYAVAIDKIIDASFGYFIMPIISVLFGFLFFNEKLNFHRLMAIILVILSILYLLFSFGSVPWIGLSVAFSWAIYNLLRKKINVDTDIGLLIESLFILPFALLVFYLIYQKGLNDFSIEDPSLLLLLLLAGPCKGC